MFLCTSISLLWTTQILIAQSEEPTAGSEQSINQLHWADIAKSEYSTQIILDFEQVPYIRKKLSPETQQLRISFPGMKLSYFDAKQVLSKLSQLKELGIAEKIELYEKVKKYPKVVLAITFAKTRTIKHEDNSSEIVKNSLLIKWCKMENPNRLIIDIFTKESLMKLKQRDSIFLQAYNDNTTVVSDTQQSLPSAFQPSQQKIIIDAGHGGLDEGAKAFGLIEKNLALEIAKKTRTQLQNDGYSVFLTRNNDTEISLSERTELAQQLKANLYVAIHLNSGGKVNSPASGIETYYLNTNGLLAPNRQGGFVFINLEKDLEQTQTVDNFLQANANKSQRLAQDIQNSLLSTLRTNNHPVVNRGIKPNYFRILLFNPTPTVLVEVGFITNKTEAKLLNSNSYQELIAQGICNGIRTFLSHNSLN